MLAGPLKTHGQSLGGFSVLGRVRLTKERRRISAEVRVDNEVYRASFVAVGSACLHVYIDF